MSDYIHLLMGLTIKTSREADYLAIDCQTSRDKRGSYSGPRITLERSREPGRKVLIHEGDGDPVVCVHIADGDQRVTVYGKDQIWPKSRKVGK